MPVQVSDPPKTETEILGFLVFEAPARAPFLPRLFSLCGSVLVHALVILALAAIGQPAKQPDVSAYKILIAPYEKKIVWYHFHTRLPSVSPSQSLPDIGHPRKKTIHSPQTLVTQNHAPDGKQIVWIPRPKIELPRDLPAPNILAIAKYQQAGPPAPLPAPKPKLFVPPPPRPLQKVTAAVRQDLPQPGPLIPSPEKANPLLPLMSAQAPGPPVKRFQPPPRAARATAPGNAAPPVLSDAPPSLSPQDSSNLSAAVIGLHPSDRLNAPLPPASRQPRISAGPNLDGTPNGRETAGPATAIIPGVTTHGADTLSGGSHPATISPRRIPVLAEATPEQKRAWSEIRTTLLVPMRPSSRVIPAALEARFHNRAVYVVAIPMPDDPVFAGDWTIWFSEKAASNPDATYVIRPPVPVGHAADSLPDPPSTPAPERRIELSAIIQKDGQVDSIAVFRGLDERSNLLAISALRSWRFLPALRNNIPVAIEAIVDLPLRQTTSAASR